MTTEVVEGVVVREDRDEEPDRRLALVGQRQQSVQVGLGSVMSLSDEQFEANLILLQKGKERAKRLQTALLDEGVDYGTEPGISRPFLHKPGAEKFEKAYGFAIEYAVERKVGDGDKTPELEYICHARVHLGDTEGPVIAEGLGSCNTHESKYRYRQAKPACPDCGKATIIKGKEDGKLKGKYWCATRDGGCGHTFEPNSDKGRALAEQPTGQVENENPYDLANTILKMARKRAGVDAILTATGTSGLFSQDADSPSVQQDARRGAAPAASGGEAGTKSAASSLAGPNTATKLPAPGKFEDGKPVKSLGVGELIGTVKVVPDKQRSDGNLRQTPEGPIVGFRLVVPSGQEIAQVEVRDALADALSLAVSHNPSRLDGLEMLLAGELFACTWTKDGETMPPFYRLAVTGIRTAEWSVPAGAAPAAEPAKAESKKRATKAEQKAADDAAAAAANDDSADDEPVAAGPGMTLDAFTEAAKPFRLAKAYVEAACKAETGTTDIAAITDQQRHKLAEGLGLFEQP